MIHKHQSHLLSTILTHFSPQKSELFDSHIFVTLLLNIHNICIINITVRFIIRYAPPLLPEKYHLRVNDISTRILFLSFCISIPKYFYPPPYGAYFF